MTDVDGGRLVRTSSLRFLGRHKEVSRRKIEVGIDLAHSVDVGFSDLLVEILIELVVVRSSEGQLLVGLGFVLKEVAVGSVDAFDLDGCVQGGNDDHDRQRKQGEQDFGADFEISQDTHGEGPFQAKERGLIKYKGTPIHNELYSRSGGAGLV